MRCSICDSLHAESVGNDFLCRDCLEVIQEVLSEYDEIEGEEEPDEDASDLPYLR